MKANKAHSSLCVRLLERVLDWAVVDVCTCCFCNICYTSFHSIYFIFIFIFFNLYHFISSLLITFTVLLSSYYFFHCPTLFFSFRLIIDNREREHRLRTMSYVVSQCIRDTNIEGENDEQTTIFDSIFTGKEMERGREGEMERGSDGEMERGSDGEMERGSDGELLREKDRGD